MKIPAEFDEIRPYTPEELPAVFDELLADPQFLPIALSFFPGATREQLRAQLALCPTNLDVQRRLFYPLVRQLAGKTCTALDFETNGLPVANYTFISNHRDIVLDSAFLSVLLLDKGFPTTVEIAIGDNLLVYPWIKMLVRVNKSFIVQRSVGMRQMLESSSRLSRYMHFAVAEKKENIWIAQREGRAKDSDDRTQDALLKMMAMGGEGTPADRLRSLNLVPLAISYEYDPCDYLKAKEFQQKRDDPSYRKTREDDLLNMQTGINGRKGHVHYQAAAPINTWIDECAVLPKAAFFDAVAKRIDRAIHSNYRLYPTHCIAADRLDGNARFAGRYTADDVRRFDDYLDGQLAKINLPGKDEDFLRERLLTMYANPARNWYAAQ